MAKVIVFDMAFAKGVIAEGECDLIIKENHYLKVSGELYNAACVLKDTSEARMAVEVAVKANSAAEHTRTMMNLLTARYLRLYSASKETL